MSAGRGDCFPSFAARSDGHPRFVAGKGWAIGAVHVSSLTGLDGFCFPVPALPCRATVVSSLRDYWEVRGLRCRAGRGDCFPPFASRRMGILGCGRVVIRAVHVSSLTGLDDFCFPVPALPCRATVVSSLMGLLGNASVGCRAGRGNCFPTLRCTKRWASSGCAENKGWGTRPKRPPDMGHPKFDMGTHSSKA